MEPFQLKVIYAGKSYTYRVEQTEVNERNEKYKVITRSQVILVSNNRPFLRKKGLKHWKPTWVVEEGNILVDSFKTKLLESMSDYVDSREQKNTKHP
jgi:hypothetical protein